MTIAVTLSYNSAEGSYVIFTLASDTYSSSVTQYVNFIAGSCLRKPDSVANTLLVSQNVTVFVADSRLRKSGRLSVRLSGQQPQHSSAHASRDGVANQRPADRSGRRRLAGYAGIHPLRLSYVPVAEQTANHRPVLICMGHLRSLPLEFRPGNSFRAGPGGRAD